MKWAFYGFTSILMLLDENDSIGVLYNSFATVISKGRANICLTCNSGPKGLARFVPSEATAQTTPTGIVRLKQFLGVVLLLYFSFTLNLPLTQLSFFSKTFADFLLQTFIYPLLKTICK